MRMTTQIGALAVLASMTLFLLGLAFTVGIDPYIRRERRRISDFMAHNTECQRRI